MNMNKTAFLAILDRSGSMHLMWREAIGGFNTFLSEQQIVPGEATVTIVLFDDQYEILCLDTPIKDVTPLDNTTFIPRGSTALYDAVGRGINELGTALSKQSEADRPGKVIVAILTDGHENSSKEFGRRQIFDMIKTQRETYNWSFLFLGAEESALEVGVGLGILKNMCSKYTGDAIGTMSAFYSASVVCANLRSGDSQVCLQDVYTATDTDLRCRKCGQ